MYLFAVYREDWILWPIRKRKQYVPDSAMCKKLVTQHLYQAYYWTSYIEASAYAMSVGGSVERIKTINFKYTFEKAGTQLFTGVQDGNVVRLPFDRNILFKTWENEL